MGRQEQRRARGERNPHGARLLVPARVPMRVRLRHVHWPDALAATGLELLRLVGIALVCLDDRVEDHL